MDQSSDQVKTQNQKFSCLECKNEITVPSTSKVDDYIECGACGIEYLVTTVSDGEFGMQLIEEEK